MGAQGSSLSVEFCAPGIDRLSILRAYTSNQNDPDQAKGTRAGMVAGRAVGTLALPLRFTKCMYIMQLLPPPPPAFRCRRRCRQAFCCVSASLIPCAAWFLFADKLGPFC